LLLVGCGGTTHTPTAREVVQAYVDALKHRDGAKACAQFTDEYRQQLAGFYSSCENYFEKHPDERLRYGLFLHRIEVNGDRATAEVVTRRGPETTYSIELARINGQWRLTGNGV
jgi:hypothetical protein